MTTQTRPKQTPAFYVQSIISFAVSTVAVLLAIAYLPVDKTRSFFALGFLYVVTSSLTLAKCVRDQHEASQVVHRVDEARLERFLAEHDPWKAQA